MRIKKYDKWLLTITLALLVFGIVMMASIGVPKSIDLTRPAGVRFPICGQDGVDCYFVLKKHITRVLIALGFLYVGFKVNYQIWKKYAVVLFLGAVSALIAVLIAGSQFTTFAKSWIVIANNSIQPAEIAKLCLIFYLAIWFERKGSDILDFQKGFISFSILAGAIILPVILQPDLGSTMIFAFIAVGMYYLAGAVYKHLAIGFVAMMFFLSLIIPNSSYLKHRFKAYINPSENNCQVESQAGNRKDYCWQTHQANIAVASGGFFGRGLTKGVQKSYWLPQASDDFIFAASAEELGFVRISILVLLYLFLAVRGFLVAKFSQDRFAFFLASGITIWIVAQAFTNIAVNIGLLPVTGITLPFISYGGSSLLASCLGIGILLNLSQYTSYNYESSSSRWRNRRPRKS